MALFLVQPVGQFDGQIDAFLDQARAFGVLIVVLALGIERRQQLFEIVGELLLAEGRIVPCPLDVVLGGQIAH